MEVVRYLNKESLLAFLNDEILAIHVRNFIDDHVLLEKLSKYLLNHESREKYLHELHKSGGRVEYEEYQVDRVGYPRNKIFADTKNLSKWNRYIEQGEIIYNEIKKISLPFDHPIDFLIDKINKIDIFCAEIEKFRGKRLFVGIGRITLAGKNSPLELKPHIDTVPASYGITKQFSANIYLSMPDDNGGGIELWNTPPLSISESNTQDTFVFDRKSNELPIIIHPKAGDLVLINTRRPHAVQSFLYGNRTSIQAFWGMTYENKLRFWS